MKNSFMKIGWYVLGIVIASIGIQMFAATGRQRTPMVRVIPYSIHPQDGTINMLLVAHPSNLWGPLETSRTADDRHAASTLLQSLSPAYRLLDNYIEHVGRTTGDHYFFVTVPYKTVLELGKSSSRDCLWASANLLAREQTPLVQRLGKRVQIRLTHSFFEFLQRNWPAIAAHIGQLQGEHGVPTDTGVRRQGMPTAAQWPVATGVGYPQEPITWPEYERMLMTMLGTGKGGCGAEQSCYEYDETRHEKISRRDCSEEVFRALDIQLTPAQVRECFARFGIIVHRQPKERTLVIGCGNLPPYKEGFNVSQIDDYIGHEKQQEYRQKHAHEQCDTIDPDFSRNPTILCSFGHSDITPLFGRHKYSQIIIEGIQLRGDLDTIKLINNLLEDSGELINCGVRLTKKWMQDRIAQGKGLWGD